MEVFLMDLLDRFLKYIAIPTNSNSETQTTPSTETQWKLANILVAELKELHMDEVWLDGEHCYVYAFLKGIENVPKIGFIAHMDTSSSVTDINVRPRIWNHYDGNSVQLNEKELLDVTMYPDLKKHIGKTLLTTDGNTLLGSDDKAGIAEIMSMLETIIGKDIPHGDIYVAFTPDEEIGEGTKYFDFSKFKADFAFTIDGSDLGEICYENFNAATVTIQIEGVSTHLGSAKNVLVNSQLIANEILYLLPKEYPETTEGYEGYYHLASIQGNVANTKLQFLIRDFEMENFEKRKQKLQSIVASLNSKYKNCITIEISDTFYNMKEVLVNHMHIIENAKKAMHMVNVPPITREIRGGTDGSNLSRKGLPCPNLGTGGHNFHGIHEYICLEDMEKVVKILVEILQLYAKAK